MTRFIPDRIPNDNIINGTLGQETCLDDAIRFWRINMRLSRRKRKRRIKAFVIDRTSIESNFSDPVPKRDPVPEIAPLGLGGLPIPRVALIFRNYLKIIFPDERYPNIGVCFEQRNDRFIQDDTNGENYYISYRAYQGIRDSITTPGGDTRFDGLAVIPCRDVDDKFYLYIAAFYFPGDGENLDSDTVVAIKTMSLADIVLVAPVGGGPGYTAGVRIPAPSRT